MVFDVLAGLLDAVALWSHEIHGLGETMLYKITSIRCLALHQANKISLG